MFLCVNILRTVISSFDMHHHPLYHLLRHKLWLSFWFGRYGVGLGVCISYKFPGYVLLTLVWQTTLWEPNPYASAGVLCHWRLGNECFQNYTYYSTDQGTITLYVILGLPWMPLCFIGMKIPITMGQCSIFLLYSAHLSDDSWNHKRVEFVWLFLYVCLWLQMN